MFPAICKFFQKRDDHPWNREGNIEQNQVLQWMLIEIWIPEIILLPPSLVHH